MILSQIQKLDTTASITMNDGKTLISLWGPHIGMYQYYSPSQRINRTSIPQYETPRFQNYRFWNRSLRNLVQNLKLIGTKKDKTYVVARHYSNALENIPVWALKEIRRWNRKNQCAVAIWLYHTGPQGVEALHKKASLYLTLTNLTIEMKCVHKLKKVLQIRHKYFVRYLFPNSTGQSHNVIRKELAKIPLGPTHRKNNKFFHDTGFDYQILFTGLIWGVKERQSLSSRGYWYGNMAQVPLLKDQTDILDRFIDLSSTHKYMIEDASMLMHRYPELRDKYFNKFLAVKTLERIHKLHNAVVNEARHLQRIHIAAQYNQTFPEPIVKGNDVIRYLCNGNELREEGDKQHHCVETYISRALNGTSFLYSVNLDSESATLELAKDKTIRQLYGPCNKNVSLNLKNTVTEWLKND